MLDEGSSHVWKVTSNIKHVSRERIRDCTLEQLIRQYEELFCRVPCGLNICAAVNSFHVLILQFSVVRCKS